MALSTLQRFWRKVRKTETCWLWVGAKRAGGYGSFWIGDRTVGTHRYAYSLANPDKNINGLDVLHKCDTPACVNPAHLFTGDHYTNMQDAAVKGRLWQNKVLFCPRGHEYTPSNTRLTAAGSRYCLACKRERIAEKRALDRKNWVK